ncbi:MAG: hypothetical protein R3F30_08580 [Planctomycetota bacterium]
MAVTVNAGKAIAGALLPFLLVLSAPSRALSAPAPFQDTDLAKEQQALLQRADRLEKMMKELLTRYEREGRKDYVRLLKEGLSFLGDSKLDETLTEAWAALSQQQKSRAIAAQTKALNLVEELLARLLDRRSIEDLEKDAASLEERLRELDALRARQRQLEDKLAEERERARTEAERALTRGLEELARDQRREAAENAQRSSATQDALERARDRIADLEQQAEGLDQRLQREAEGKPDAAATTGQRIGELLAKARAGLEALMAAKAAEAARKDLADLAKEVEDGKARPEAAAKASRSVEDAARAAERAARSRTEAGTEVAKDDAGPTPEELSALAKELAEAGPGPDRPAKLDADLGRKAGDMAKRLGEDAKQDLGRLGKESRDLAEQSEAVGKAVDERAEATTPPEDDAAAARRANQERALDKDTARQLGDAAQRFRKAAEDLDRAAASDEPRPGQAELDTQEGITKLHQALERQQRRDRDALARARELEQQSGAMAEDLARLGQERPEAGKAAEALEKAEQAFGGTRQQLEQGKQGQPQASGEQRQQGREQLAEARKALDQELSKLRERSGESAARAQERQKELQKRAEELARGMQKARQAGDIGQEQQQGASPRLDEAREAMDRAQEQLSKGSLGQAAREQQDAARKLQESAQELARNRKPDASGQQRMDELAKRQEELVRDIQELARRIDAKKQRDAMQHLDEAAKQAQQAQEQMQRGDPEEADQAQQRTREELDKARQELEKERDQYLRLRQEELLFKISDEVEQLIAKQTEIQQQTLSLKSQQPADGKLPRGLRSQLRQLGRREGELAEKTRFLADNLEKEQTLVFTFVLEQLTGDLEDLAGRLGERTPEIDDAVLDLQAEVLEQMKWLLGALRDQLRQKQQERQQEQGQQQDQQQQGENTNEGDRKKRLIPDRAELMLLRRLELEAQARIQQMLELEKALGGDFPDVGKSRLERLAHWHAKVSDLFRQFVEQRGLSLDGPKPEGHGDGGDGEGKSDGEGGDEPSKERKR